CWWTGSTRAASAAARGAPSRASRRWMLRENQASAAATVTARAATTPLGPHTTPAMAVSLRPWRAQRRSVVGAARPRGVGNIRRGAPGCPPPLEDADRDRGARPRDYGASRRHPVPRSRRKTTPSSAPGRRRLVLSVVTCETDDVCCQVLRDCYPSDLARYP